MARDSLYGERIVWTGRPKSVRPSALLRAMSGLCFVTSAISVLFAVVTSLVLRVTPTSTLLFGFWATALGIAFRSVPRMFLERATYVVTEHHVVVHFGPFRRSIQRGTPINPTPAISSWCAPSRPELYAGACCCACRVSLRPIASGRSCAAPKTWHHSATPRCRLASGSIAVSA